jgi:hypothetical protein
MPWYKAGTVSVVQNSNTVIGTNTSFIANSRVGDGFLGPDGRWYEITNIASDTALAISPYYLGATNGAGTYALVPINGYPKALADAFNALNNQFGSTLAVFGNQGTPAGLRNALQLGTVATENTVPVDKGGTGAKDAAAAQTNLGLKNATADLILKSVALRGAATGFGTNGFYVGWNGEGAAGSANFIVNRGGGLGGYSFRSVNSDNTASGPITTLSYEGVLDVPGGIRLNGVNISERGSTSGGNYTKYSDGTMICSTQLSVGTLTAAVGALWGTGTNAGASFPAAFVVEPVVVATAYTPSPYASDGLIAACYQKPTNTSWGYYRALSALNSLPGGAWINLVAYGRWK